MAWLILALSFTGAYAQLDPFPPDCSKMLSGYGENGKCSSSYWRCDHGKRALFHCPKHLYFDVGTEACQYKAQTASCERVWNSGADTAASPPSFNCSGRPNGLQEFSDGPCSSRFIHCMKGVALPYHCPRGHVYQASLKKCTPTEKIPECTHISGQGCEFLISDLKVIPCNLTTEVCLSIDPTNGTYTCPLLFTLRFGFPGTGNADQWTNAHAGLECDGGHWYSGNLRVSAPAVYCSAKRKDLQGETRIANGRDADPRGLKSMVQLMFKQPSGQLFHLCGGTLIKPDMVISAAHCRNQEELTKEDYVILTGSDRDGEGKQHRIVQEVIHEGFVRFSKKAEHHDLVLFRISPPITVSATTDFTELNPVNAHPVDDDCYVLGWGANERLEYPIILQNASLTEAKNERCGPEDDFFNHQQYICVRDRGERKSTCSGDSGGPIVCRFSATSEVQGVMSYGYLKDTPNIPLEEQECDPSLPSVYTRLTHYMKWIERTETQMDDEWQRERHGVDD